jgi:hypothetical protein
LYGSPEDTLPQKNVRGGITFLEYDVCGMPSCWYASEFPYGGQQPGSGIDNVGAFGRRRSKSSPSNRRGFPHTSSADYAFPSSFHALEIPTNCNDPAQCSSAFQIRAALTCRGDISIIPLKAGCHTWSRRDDDDGQGQAEKGLKLLPLVGFDLLGGTLNICHVFNMHLCKLREFETNYLTEMPI